MQSRLTSDEVTDIGPEYVKLIMTPGVSRVLRIDKVA